MTTAERGFKRPIDPFVTLESKDLRLEPLKPGHFDALIDVGTVRDLWRWTTANAITPEAMRDYLNAALTEREKGNAIPFATFDKISNRIVGSTRFASIDSANRRLEIGWTWITPSAQRTHVNSNAKLLMLTYAFEELGCIRVELKTDALNTKSRNAMVRIGCKEEGVLRSHMITDTGRVRDTAYYSILEAEWPAVRKRLEEIVT